jgi:hypothetical protein
MSVRRRLTVAATLVTLAFLPLAGGAAAVSIDDPPAAFQTHV